ncbi:hypothetical protein HYH03_008075 [Edaphochlamys debaryana]|uniref:Membrane protein insertion efficiency factor n=1 Tax=Edaphochlamys debaryana TaxID=47281 RepID=A0A835Y257_9CHLO|nr:hypothetical protein HYH03_008075 [Edaphochlamys debaryana]|eukprot:KAG2493859.1 hypothetical protein HYH03_008075 [Edaphochlamys debaryana]
MPSYAFLPVPAPLQPSAPLAALGPSSGGGSGGGGGPDGRDDVKRSLPGDKGSSGSSSSTPDGSGRVGDGGGGGAARGSEGDGGRQGGEAQPSQGEEEPPPSVGVRIALSMLGFYRSALSPLMPSTCRFLPTCSNYSIESYKKFGVTKGTVLTAWRLLRCNPWGGRGYDPPAWPPVGLGAVYTLPYTPELTVVLIVYVGYSLVTGIVDAFSI